MGWLLLSVIVVAVVVFVMTTRRRKVPETAPRSDPLSSKGDVIDIRRLSVGDVLIHANRDYIVRGTLDFDDGGARWREHLLDDIEVRRWLSVEDDETLEVAMWESVDVDVEPGAKDLVVDGVAYRLDEHGTARFQATGSTGTAAEGTYEYWDYEAADGALLSFERFGTGEVEAGRGTSLLEREIDIYPAGEGLP